MIRVLSRPEGAADFSPMDHEEIGRLGRFDLAWIDISGDDTATAGGILDSLGLEVPSGAAETLTGVSETDRAVFLDLPTFVVSEGGGVRASGYLMVISSNALVTIHEAPIAAIDRQWTSADSGPLGRITSVELGAHVASSVSRLVLPLIDELEQRTDGMEELAFAADPRTLTEVHALRNDLIALRRVVSKHREIMDDLAILVHPAIGEQGQAAFRRAFEHDDRIVDLMDSNRLMLISLLETYRGAVADQTNEIVRVLTVFSAILLPLGLIAGAWGMNFVEIPWAREPWGFGVLIGSMALVAAGLWTYFARRGFVGAPRLRDIPKSVGLGLLQVGKAPVRAITHGVGSGIQGLQRISRSQRDEEG